MQHIPWRQQLADGLADTHCALDAAQQQRLLDYLALLDKWNRPYNLTAVREVGEMVSRQLLDSLAILPWTDQGPVLDAGTGAGLPGIPLAIARPDLAFTLIDSNGKKTRFVQQAVAELGLANVETVRARVEELPADGGYAVVTARALASLDQLVRLVDGLLAPGGRILALKGRLADDEVERLGPGYAATQHQLRVPGSDRDRRLVVVERST